MSRIGFAVLIALMLAMPLKSIAGETNGQSFTFHQFQTNLHNLESQTFKTKLYEHDLTVTRITAEGTILPEDSWPAILQLWVAGEYDLVRLLWWEKDYSQTRAFIVSLEWCMVALPEKNAKAWPKGISWFESDATRFERTERDLRLQETEFVREHYSEIAHELSVILSHSNIELAKRYEASSKASKATAANANAPNPAANYSTDGSLLLRYVKHGGIAGVHDELLITTVPLTNATTVLRTKLETFCVSSNGAVAMMEILKKYDVASWPSEKRRGLNDAIYRDLTIQTAFLTNTTKSMDGPNNGTQILRWENLISELRSAAGKYSANTNK